MEIHQRGRRVLVTGGSGFYLKSFLEPVIDRIQVPEAVVRQVAELEKKGREALAAELLRIDPDAAEVLDTENPRRVARALERCLATGRSVRELREAMRNEPYPFMHCRPQTSLLIRDREELRERIVRRVDEMLAGGLAEEVRRLVSRGLRNNPSAATAIGYRETSRYLEGELTFAQLREEMIRNTNRLVKKQLTWFRYQLPESSRTISLTGREDLPVKELFVGLGGA